MYNNDDNKKTVWPVTSSQEFYSSTDHGQTCFLNLKVPML